MATIAFYTDYTSSRIAVAQDIMVTYNKSAAPYFHRAAVLRFWYSDSLWRE